MRVCCQWETSEYMLSRTLVDQSTHWGLEKMALFYRWHLKSTFRETFLCLCYHSPEALSFGVIPPPSQPLSLLPQSLVCHFVGPCYYRHRTSYFYPQTTIPISNLACQVWLGNYCMLGIQFETHLSLRHELLIFQDLWPSLPCDPFSKWLLFTIKIAYHSSSALIQIVTK